MSQLAKPPIIDSDIATSEQFYSHSVSGIPHAPNVNFQHRYGRAAPGITGMDLAPAGHGPNGQGLYAFVATQDSSIGGIPALRGAFHPRALKAEDYTTGWQHIPINLSLPPDRTARFTRTYGRVASQRLGSWVYFFGWVSAYRPTVLGVLGEPVRYDTTGRFGIYRIGPAGVETILETTISTDGEDAGSGNSLVPLRGLDSIDGLPQDGGGRCSFFVSDDATPFIWHTAGDISSLANSDNPVWSTGFAHGSPLGTWKRTTAGANLVTGQLGAYLQKAALPAGQYGFGPYLVFPWGAGNYGPPEQWFFLQRGPATFDIYRARWLRAQMQRYTEVQVVDDPDYTNQSRQFPALNPSGFAFEHNWYRSANRVGTLGPVPGVAVHNPLVDASSNGQIVFPYFSVLRDRRRVGNLHLVLADGSPTGAP